MIRRAKILALAVALVALGGCASEAPKPVSASGNECPTWTDYPADSHSNADSPYLGCANVMNLAHMAEDPKDIKHGRDLGPADGARQATALKNYEEGKVKKPEGSGTSQIMIAPVQTGGSEAQ